MIFIRTENNVDGFHEKNIYRLVRANECAFSPPSTIFTKLNTDGWVDYALVRIHTSNIQKVLSDVKKTYKTFCVNFPFDYSFFNEKINQAYEKEMRTAKIISWFSVFAILISSLGIFTLAVFMGNSRTKEIDIRKVNGAKISELLVMLNQILCKKGSHGFFNSLSGGLVCNG